MYEDSIIDSASGSDSNLTLNQAGRDYLYKAGNWAMFLAVLGFIGLALNLLSTLYIFTMSSRMTMGLGNQFGSFYLVAGFVSLIVLGFFAYPIFKLFNFAQNAKRAGRAQDNTALTTSLDNLHGYFKWIGIFIIMVIALYFLLIAFFAYSMSSAQGF